MTPLRFAITSPLSGCEEDSGLQAVDHARRTKKSGWPFANPLFSLLHTPPTENGPPKLRPKASLSNKQSDRLELELLLIVYSNVRIDVGHPLFFTDVTKMEWGN